MDEGTKGSVKLALRFTEAALEGSMNFLDASREIISLDDELEPRFPASMSSLRNLTDILDDIPTPQVGLLWNKEAVNALWESRDRYLESARPSLEARFQGFRSELIKSLES